MEPSRALSAGALAGVSLAALDLASGLARHSAHLAFADRARVALGAAGTLALAGMVLAGLAGAVHRGLRASPPRVAPWVVAALGGAWGSIAGIALFSGSGVRRWGLRPYGITLAVMASAALASWLWRRRDGLRATLASPGASAVSVLVALALYGAHATVLTRQYPLLHGLAAGASLLMLAWPFARVSAHRAVLVASLLLGVAGAAVTVRFHGVRTALRQGAPAARYAAMAVAMLRRERLDDADEGAEARIAGPHLPLAGHDLVLVTVDALRADALTALGGRGRTPTLDALAARGVLFRRAYCATPHTSYSLASLMMGTWARSVLALPGAARDRETLASWLGAAGYATAGFFPPAVFAVDGERFARLRATHFGFGTAVEAYADGATRVREVSRWLDTRRPDERVFVWVHLFEPHEPYEAHAAHPYGPSARDRYDAECSAADDALAALRAAFERRHRRAAWVVTADHGEEFGEHGGSFHGTSVYDEQVRVPLVVDAPGLAHAEIDAPVSLVDVAVTMLGGVGLARPPRVRGNDLGALVANPSLDTRIFAANGSLRRVSTARDTLVVDLSDGTLERYDPVRDPHETRNLADTDPARAQQLRRTIAAWEASHARAEAERASPGAAADVALPDVLQRAIQGDVSTAGEVATLLGAGGFPVRRRAAHTLGELGVRDRAVLDALARELDAPDATLREEAALSLALLGDARGAAGARAAFDARRNGPLEADTLRAALAVATLGDHAAVPVLAAWINNPHGTDTQRDAAVASLRALRDPAARPAWERLLLDMRLAPRGADALGELGDPAALDALREGLRTQRYPISIRAMLGAMAALHADDLAARVREGLLASDPLPDVWMLLDAMRAPGLSLRGFTGALSVGPRGAVIPLRGGVAGDRRLPLRRLYLRTRSTAAARLTVANRVTVDVPEGEGTVVVELTPPMAPAGVRVVSTAPVVLVSCVAP